MTIESLQNRKESILATARELAAGDGDLGQVKSLMAEAKGIEERIETIKSLGVTAPVASPAVEDKPWKSGGVSKRVVDMLPGSSADERNYKAYAWGQWARSIMGNRKATDWVKGNLKAQSEGTDSAGGYTVPDPLSSDLIYLREQFGIARQNARIYPMSSDTLRVPNATASTTVYYPGENTAITESSMTFAQVSLTAKKAAVLTQVSKELAEDSIIDFGASLARDMAYVLAKEEDRVVFNNAVDATSGIDGILYAVYNLNATKANIASLVQFTTGQTITYAPTLSNLSTMVGRLPTYAANAKWFMHKEIWYNSIAPLLNALSGNAILDIQQAFGAQPKLFGYDVVFVQNMQKTLAASTPYILLGDLSVGTAFGDRRSVTIEVSDQRYFVEDALAFKATERYAFSAFDTGNVNATAASRVPGSLIVGASSAT
jgi:HK97 family phage major capsid protein